jgi:hypothetical protein
MKLRGLRLLTDVLLRKSSLSAFKEILEARLRLPDNTVPRAAPNYSCSQERALGVLLTIVLWFSNATVVPRR